MCELEGRNTGPNLFTLRRPEQRFIIFATLPGLKACVVSVSGGVDSAVTLALCKHAQAMPNSPLQKVSSYNYCWVPHLVSFVRSNCNCKRCLRICACAINEVNAKRSATETCMYTLKFTLMHIRTHAHLRYKRFRSLSTVQIGH